MKRKIPPLTGGTLLAILLFPALLSGCGSGEAQQKPASPAAAPPPEVDVVTVAAGPAVLTQDLPGRLQAYRTAQVRARVEGIVEKRLFAEGSDVKAGDTLFQIDARNYQATYHSARADVAIARQTVERYKPLLDVKAVSRQEYDLAEARLKQAEAALSRAQLDWENTHVPASIAGRIGRALVTEGALVGKGEATLLATIEQLDPIYVNFTQPGADMLRLRQAIKSGKLRRAESASVELLLEDGSIYPKTGRIFFTDMSVDPSTGAVSLRAEFPNPQRELLPGMFVRLRFPQAQADNAIRVPQRAVQAGPQGQFVMIVTPDGKAALLPIRTGGMAGGDFIVAEGLKGGEQVIVNGLQKARPGTAVAGKPLAPPSASSGQAKPSPAGEKGESEARQTVGGKKGN
ncbi:MAG: efflux RND transporter periplasmic adaptor subunit [Nitrosomonadales bacterium]|nr:efflux RND transporter periplasmic adaptor subunit [Nitrosomonadales bacterium]